MRLLKRIVNDAFVAVAYMEAYVAGKWIAYQLIDAYDKSRNTRTGSGTSHADSVRAQANRAAEYDNLAAYRAHEEKWGREHQ